MHPHEYVLGNKEDINETICMTVEYNFSRQTAGTHQWFPDQCEEIHTREGKCFNSFVKLHHRHFVYSVYVASVVTSSF